MATERPLSIGIVGPTFPYSGGVSSHTTTLANRLIASGHDVDMVSWKAQYPKFLRDARVPDGEPEVEPVPGARSPLAWYNPFGWIRVGRELRKRDVVLVTAVTPYHAVPYLVMRTAMGRRTAGIVIAHNVLPHERGGVDRALVRALYRRFGRVLVHSQEQSRLAEEIVADSSVEVAIARMPLPDLLFGDTSRNGSPMGSTRHPAGDVTLVFFGMVREYKGVDLAIEAMASVASTRLIIAGEFWQPVDSYRRRITELGLDDRVTIEEGYLKLSALPKLFARADALVLPYRAGSATYNVDLAFHFGLPVIASDAGTMPRDVRDGVDGIVVRRGDVESLAEAFRAISDPAVLDSLKRNVNTTLSDEQWLEYEKVLVRLAGVDGD